MSQDDDQHVRTQMLALGISISTEEARSLAAACDRQRQRMRSLREGEYETVDTLLTLSLYGRS